MVIVVILNGVILTMTFKIANAFRRDSLSTLTISLITPLQNQTMKCRSRAQPCLTKDPPMCPSLLLLPEYLQRRSLARIRHAGRWTIRVARIRQHG